MKNHLVISLLILSVGCSPFQKEFDIKNISEFNGVYKEDFTNEIVNGIVYAMFGEKKVILGEIIDGKKNGKWEIWYKSGRKYSERNYKDGKDEGLWTEWHENGQKSYEGTFKDGKEDGLKTKWYEDGQKKEEGTWKDGKKDGLFTGWNYNGVMMGKGIYKDGNRDGEWIWSNDKDWKGLKAEQKYGSVYKDGKPLSGLFIEYIRVKQIDYKGLGSYKDGEKDGLWHYQENHGFLYMGDLNFEGIYKNGKRIGTWERSKMVNFKLETKYIDCSKNNCDDNILSSKDSRWKNNWELDPLWEETRPIP